MTADSVERFEELQTTLPLRIAVGEPNGMRSATWRFWRGKRSSDVYGAMRHIADQFKLSLHQSGNCRLAYTTKYFADRASQFTPGQHDRASFKWKRPTAERRPTTVLRIVIPHSELRNWYERRPGSTRFLPASRDAVATEIDLAFLAAGNHPPGWPDMNSGSEPLCRIELPNSEVLWVTYQRHRDDRDYRDATARRTELEALAAEESQRHNGPIQHPHIGGVVTMCTNGSLLIVETAQDQGPFARNVNGTSAE